MLKLEQFVQVDAQPVLDDLRVLICRADFLLQANSSPANALGPVRLSTQRLSKERALVRLGCSSVTY
jgi:hypothetical protein